MANNSINEKGGPRWGQLLGRPGIPSTHRRTLGGRVILKRAITDEPAYEPCTCQTCRPTIDSVFRFGGRFRGSVEEPSKTQQEGVKA